MTNRQKAAVAAAGLGTAVVGAVAGVQLTGSSPTPRGVISEAVVNGCHTVPGKSWGGKFHYSAAILRPTVIETYCITYPTTGFARTRVRVSYAPAVP